MLVNKRIEAIVKLGDFLGQFQPSKIVKKDKVLYNDLFFESFKQQIKRAKEFNGWFTDNNVLNSFYNWSKLLNNNDLTKWLSSYSLNKTGSKNIAVIMAGNIPLVGFHDFLSVLISGNNIIVKQSSNDKHFLPLIAKYLEKVEPEFKDKILFTDKKFQALKEISASFNKFYFPFYIFLIYIFP